MNVAILGYWSGNPRFKRGGVVAMRLTELNDVLFPSRHARSLPEPKLGRASSFLPVAGRKRSLIRNGGAYSAL